MKKFQKLIALFLALLMLLTLSACTDSLSAEDMIYGALDEISQNLDEIAVDQPEDISEDVLLPEPAAPPEEAPASQPPATTDEPDAEPMETPAEEPSPEPGDILAQDGVYTTKEDVALYLHIYGTLPSNFITKKEAESLGWPGGDLEPYAPGKCIGGNRFGNYEGMLPDAPGRTWQECDIDTLGASSRGAKRIVYSNDGLIYYTEDHYESFELLYGEE